MAIQIQLRNDTAANWTTANPVLAVGELGLESDTGSYKIGNGVDTWSALPYGGVDGASAYDIAVSNGFVGDETAWLASLVGAAGADGVGVPAGGTEGQVLAKVDGTDYNTEWVDATGGGSADALTVLIFNSDSNNAINAGDIVVADQNSGNGIHYIGLKMPNDGSGNNYQFNQVLGIAIEDIPANFGEGRVAIAGTFAVPFGKFSSNGFVYIDSNNGAMAPGPSGNPLWNTPIGRATSNGSDTTLITLEKSMNTQRLMDLGDVNVNYNNITDGQVLSFNSQNYQFEFRDASGGGGGASVNDNFILNGGFDVWQESDATAGGSVAPIESKSTVPGSYYFADNWKSTQFGGTGTMTQERIVVRNAIGTEAVTEYGLQTTVTADAGGFEFQTFIEDVNTIQGEDITVSAWVKRSAGGFTVNIIDQNFGSGGSPTENIFGPGATLNPDEWTKISGSATLPATHTKNMQPGHHLVVKFNFQNIQPNEVVSIAQVKLERGTSATAFKPMFPTYTQELLACQRYFYRVPTHGQQKLLGAGKVNSNYPSTWHFRVDLPVEMMSMPTFTQNRPGTSNITVGRMLFSSGTFSAITSFLNQFYLSTNSSTQKTAYLVIVSNQDSSFTGDDGLFGGTSNGEHQMDFSARF